MGKIGIIIQARSTSTRLPNKVLKALPYGSDNVVLEQVIRRVLKSTHAHQVIVATTTDPEDDEIVALAKKVNVTCYRGSREHVLSRYYEAAKANVLDIIIRITSDCPCIDWEAIDRVITTLINDALDYVHMKLSYPRGVGDVEAMTFKTLENVYLNASQSYEIEHVTPYIYKSCPKDFKMVALEAPPLLRFPEIRVTLDTPEDYALICAVYDYLYDEDRCFTAKELIDLFNKKPWLKQINARVLQKTITDLDGEIEEGLKLLRMQDLKKAADFLQSQWKR